MKEVLAGKKTYIAGVVAAVVNLAIIMGWMGALSPEQIIAIEGLLMAVFGVTVRLGIHKCELDK